MMLKGTDGTHFGLRILGYQFPQGGSAANWLNIEIDAAFASVAWRATDPALETFEVRSLANWFEALAEARPAQDAKSFLEPNLKFERLASPGPQVLVKVRVKGELRPPHNLYPPEAEVSAHFALDAAALGAAAKSLREQLQDFPQREEPDEEV
ncbi:hypothetical protein OV208_23640 [Corallococcus sp. bb12-1]|uniref:WapI family immunity protein n=1 Tax=Corallococcus sp. bb12-1 TaxID=2996784 RepID=UPI0022702D57|nr:hypothetical protein [Corallococcus sp. bb12-1]MCY1044332.1 hypothetical protein [Corallococcus sp. bb12-1]